MRIYGVAFIIIFTIMMTHENICFFKRIFKKCSKSHRKKISIRKNRILFLPEVILLKKYIEI